MLKHYIVYMKLTYCGMLIIFQLKISNKTEKKNTFCLYLLVKATETITDFSILPQSSINSLAVSIV